MSGKSTIVAAPFAVYENEMVLGWDGVWDLYYFSSESAAKLWRERRDGIGVLTETSPGRVWRVSVKRDSVNG